MKKLLGEIKKMASENGVCELRLYVHHDNKNAIMAYEKTGMARLPYYIFSLKL